MADADVDVYGWMGTLQAGKRIGVDRQTIWKLIDTGQLPAYRFGRVIRLMSADVDRFIEESRIEPGTLEHLYPEVSTR